MDKIFTQEDYDKVTNLYNAYQNKKDKYTPDQQKQMEALFSQAWAGASNKIEEWNNRLVDMWNDEQGNTWGRYGDGRVELLNAGPKKGTKKKEPIKVNTGEIPTYQSPYNPNGQLSGSREAKAGAGSAVQQTINPGVLYM